MCAIAQINPRADSHAITHGAMLLIQNRTQQRFQHWYRYACQDKGKYGAYCLYGAAQTAVLATKAEADSTICWVVI